VNGVYEILRVDRQNLEDRGNRNWGGRSHIKKKSRPRKAPSTGTSMIRKNLTSAESEQVRSSL